MLKKCTLIIILTLAFPGCQTYSNLTPLEQSSDHYWLFYKKSEIFISLPKNTTSENEAEIYEKQINAMLGNDPNTASCYVEKGSVAFKDPGPTGRAKVKCTNQPPLEKDGLYNRDGTPSYRYWFKKSSKK